MGIAGGEDTVDYKLRHIASTVSKAFHLSAPFPPLYTLVPLGLTALVVDSLHEDDLFYVPRVLVEDEALGHDRALRLIREDAYHDGSTPGVVVQTDAVETSEGGVSGEQRRWSEVLVQVARRYGVPPTCISLQARYLTAIVYGHVSVQREAGGYSCRHLSVIHAARRALL